MGHIQLPAPPTSIINLGGGMQMSVSKEPVKHDKDIYFVVVEKQRDEGGHGENAISEDSSFADIHTITQCGIYTTVRDGEIDDWNGFIEWREANPEKGEFLTRMWLGSGFPELESHPSYPVHFSHSEEIRERIYAQLDVIAEENLTADLGDELSAQARELFRSWIYEEIEYLHSLLPQDEHGHALRNPRYVPVSTGQTVGELEGKVIPLPKGPGASRRTTHMPRRRRPVLAKALGRPDLLGVKQRLTTIRMDLYEGQQDELSFPAQ